MTSGACPGPGFTSPERDLSIGAVGRAPRPHRKAQENTRKWAGPKLSGAGWKSPAELNLVGWEKSNFPKRRVAPAQGPDWLLLTEIQ